MDDSEVYSLPPLPSGHGAGGEFDWNLSGAQTGPEPVAMAFSGGGIRSAAFCSGVLRKMVCDGANIRHMSCVSGGGYIGSSFVEWVANARAAECRKGTGKWPSIREIADDYFGHLTQNYAIYCDWRRDFPYRGLRDTAMFLTTALLSFCLLPAVALLAFVPSVLRVETVCGEYMRWSFVPASECSENDGGGGGGGGACTSQVHSPILLLAVVASVLGGAIMSLAQRLQGRQDALFAIGTWIGIQVGSLGAVVLLACLFEISARNASAQAQDPDGGFDVARSGSVALVLLCALLWAVLPGSPIRKKLGHVVAVLFSARVVQWRVFQVPADTSGESDMQLRLLIWLTALVILCMSVLGPLRFTLPFVYNRWCLQKFLFVSSAQPADETTVRRSAPLKMPVGVNLSSVHLAPAKRAIWPQLMRQLQQARRNSRQTISGPCVFTLPHSNPSTPDALRRSVEQDVIVDQPLGTQPRFSPTLFRRWSVGDSKNDVVSDSTGDGELETTTTTTTTTPRMNGGSSGFDSTDDDDDAGVDETDMALTSDYIDFDLDASMTLGDINRASGGDIELLSQVVANKWRFTHDCNECNAKLMVLSSKSIDVLSKSPEDGTACNVHLQPDDVRVADAMALSGAALSLNNGVYSETFAFLAFRALQLIFGVAIGTSMQNTDSPKPVSNQLKTLALTVVIYMLLAGSVFLHGMGIGGHWPMVVELVVSSCVTFAALLPMRTPSADECDFDGGFMFRVASAFQDLVRCVNMQCHAAFLIRELLDIDTVGLEAPCVFSVSDGGHVENLGLLPLLHRRCKRIVIADGSSYPNSKDVASSLLLAMGMARTWLRCSFTSMSGGDILSDINDKLTNPGQRGESQPHTYRFRVIYSSRSGDGNADEAPETGEILLVQPRHPSKRAHGPESGALLTDWSIEEQSAKVDRLTGCCCTCCHGCCHRLSYWLCGKFPAISTLAQGFTEDMFQAFHEEGVRAATAPNAVRLWCQKSS